MRLFRIRKTILTEIALEKREAEQLNENRVRFRSVEMGRYQKLHEIYLGVGPKIK